MTYAQARAKALKQDSEVDTAYDSGDAWEFSDSKMPKRHTTYAGLVIMKDTGVVTTVTTRIQNGEKIGTSKKVDFQTGAPKASKKPATTKAKKKTSGK